MKKHKNFTVNYILDEREQEALEELLSFYKSYEKEDGSKPFENWTSEKVFQELMEIGSSAMIADKIQLAQCRAKMIGWDERVSDGFKTMAERKIKKESVLAKLKNEKSGIEKRENVEYGKKHRRDRLRGSEEYMQQMQNEVSQR